MPMNEKYQKAKAFLESIKPLLPTKQCDFVQTEKNKALIIKYGLKEKDLIQILRSLQPEDIVEIRPNFSKEKDDSEVYIFLKDVELSYFGEMTDVKLYLKLFLRYSSFGDLVVVLSIHEEGMHDK